MKVIDVITALTSEGIFIVFVDEINDETARNGKSEVTSDEVRSKVRHWIERLRAVHERFERGHVELEEALELLRAKKQIGYFLKARMISAKEVNDIGKEVYGPDSDFYKKWWKDWRDLEEFINEPK